MEVSVVIPCFNEEGIVGDTVEAVARELREIKVSFEILVIDNLSTDRSQHVASSAGATVVSCTANTVAGVRNFGATLAKGRVLVFLDADVVVMPFWGQVFQRAWLQSADVNRVGGAHCLAPQKMSRLLSAWYKGIEKDNRDTHVGTGQMILLTSTFHRLGGFDESLITGEDYEFCVRATVNGFGVKPDEGLAATHEGYPDSVLQFFRREMWHGLGDCKSLRTFIASKVALAASFFTGFICSGIFTAWHSVGVSGLFFLGALLVLAFAVLHKFGYGDFIVFLRRILVCSVYFLGRSFSPFYKLLHRGS